MPFTVGEFFEVFARYNTAVWPLQWVLLVLGIAAAGAATFRQAVWNRVALLLVALLWLWMAVAYHLGFFSAINPLAPLFAATFALQAVLLVWSASRPQRGQSRTRWSSTAAGWGLILYAFVGYPLLGHLWGHRYPALPTFGVPCPTTIFTFGVLLLLPSVSLITFAIPVLWAVIGTSAALHLSVPQDFGLLAAALIAVAAILYRESCTRRARQTARSPSPDDRPQHALL